MAEINHAILFPGKASPDPNQTSIAITNCKVVSTKGPIESSILMSSLLRMRRVSPQINSKPNPCGIRREDPPLNKLVMVPLRICHPTVTISSSLPILLSRDPCQATQALPCRNGQPERKRRCRLQNRGLRFQMKKSRHEIYRRCTAIFPTPWVW